MALIQEIQAVTDDYINNHQPVDIYFTSNVLLFKLLTRGNTYDGGKKIKALLEYAEQNTGSYGPTSVLPVNKVEIFTEANFPYAAYFGVSTIDMDDQLLNSGSAAIVDLVHGKIRNMEKSIRKTMGAAVYAARAAGIAADPKARPLYGLADLFNQGQNFAYGEIIPADMPEWIAGEIAGARTMGFDFMQELRREASTDVTAEGKPDLYITTELLLDAFERSQQVQVRYSSEKLLNAGFDNILFKGAAVVADGNQADNTVDALNTQFLDMKTHAKRNFTKPEWKSPIDQPDTITANVRWAGQLICTNRKAHARASNVTPA